MRQNTELVKMKRMMAINRKKKNKNEAQGSKPSSLSTPWLSEIQTRLEAHVFRLPVQCPVQPPQRLAEPTEKCVKTRGPRGARVMGIVAANSCSRGVFPCLPQPERGEDEDWNTSFRGPLFTHSFNKKFYECQPNFSHCSMCLDYVIGEKRLKFLLHGAHIFIGKNNINIYVCQIEWFYYHYPSKLS